MLDAFFVEELSMHHTHVIFIVIIPIEVYLVPGLQFISHFIGGGWNVKLLFFFRASKFRALETQLVMCCKMFF